MDQMMNPKHIAEGWFNLFKDKLGILPEALKKESERKLQICSLCPQRENNTCKICSCTLTAKVKSSSNCPLSKW